MVIQKIIETRDNLDKLLKNDSIIASIQSAIELILDALQQGNKLMLCGNGGSAADAQHMAGEFLCRFYKDRRPLPAIALTTDTSTITAIANDYAYEEIFSRQVEALGKAGDVLIGMSTSGTSKNLLSAFKKAKQLQIKTILLTGERKKEIAETSDVVIAVPSTDTPRIQEMHLIIEHVLSEHVEAVFFL